MSESKPKRKTVRPATESRREARAKDRRATILSAALQQFSVNGLAGTSIDRIAETAELSKTNVFYYFASKEEIYQAILGDLLELWLEPFRAITAEGDPITLLGDYIARKLVFSRDHPEASRLFCLEMIRGAPMMADMLARDLRPVMAEKVAILRGWTADGRIAPVDPHHLFFSIWATTQHYADFATQVRSITGQGLEDAEFLAATTRQVQAILLRGLRAPDDRSRLGQ